MTNSIRKGKRREREIANLLKEAGFDSYRISMMETAGVDKGDIQLDDVVCQVKSGNHVPKTVYKFMENGEPFLFMRRDKEKWLVVMGIEEFIKLWKENNEH